MNINKNKLESYSERLNYSLMKNKLTGYKLSDLTGLPQSSISNYRKGRSVPNKITNEVIASNLNVSPDWLLTGEEENIYKNTTENIQVNEPYELQYTENKNSNSFMLLPSGQYLMTMPLAEFKIQAGFLDHYQDIEYLNGLQQHSIIVDKPLKGRYVAFRVKGDSMDDGTSDAILHNYIVTTRELQRQHWNSPLRYNDFRFWVIYTTQSAYPLLKEITGHDVEKGVIKCHSLNDAPEYTDFELSLNDVQALFYVVDINRNISQKEYF